MITMLKQTLPLFALCTLAFCGCSTSKEVETKTIKEDTTSYTIQDGQDITIDQAGVYTFSGSATNSTIYVDVDDSQQVEIILDDVSITNEETPCIYVMNADEVTITTQKDSDLSITSEQSAIFSCDDLVLNGTSTLTIESNDTGVESNDDLTILGGTYVVNAQTKAFEANDSIEINDGTFTIQAGTDGFHCENDEDDSKGSIHIQNGTFEIHAQDDGIHGTSIIQIDGGTFQINAYEGIEATYILINDGTFEIDGQDDGINASNKSSAYATTIEINGGDFTIQMAQGDTDAIDSNGDLIITGGTFNINATSAFDYDGNGDYSGGTIIVNGEQVNELSQSMMQGPQGDMKGFPMDKGMPFQK